MHSNGFGRGRNPVLITTPVHSVEELAWAISAAVFGSGRPAPRNLDGLADLLRESQATRVIVSDWRLDDLATEHVLAVFADIGVGLVR